jgi:tRNA1(Val) A37 N6-methylase TrmN6
MGMRAEVLETTTDDFYRGAFKVVQPSKTGHRSGLDALLIAASLPIDASGNLADLGSGAGVAGLAAISANPRLNAVLVEKNPIMADLARKSLKLRQNLQFSSRAEVLEADVTLSGLKRTACGLKNDHFDYVIMNPPYNEQGLRASPDLLRSEAHVMGVSGLDAWMRTAAAIMKPGAILVLIYRSEKIGEISACCQGRFGGQVIVPVHSRADEPAKRILIKMTKGSRAPLSIMPGIVTHGSDGQSTQETNALLNGEARVNFG